MNEKHRKILGIITARGGSKGIPGKNIKFLAGKPLIAYTIEAAQASGVFDRLIVSTDDEAIADVAKEYGCDVPFLRPAELAQDYTPHLPVLRHALDWLREHQGYQPEYVMILQPTSPLRTVSHICEAVELLGRTDAESIVSINEVPGHYNPHWQFQVADTGLMNIFTGEPFAEIVTRRQNLPKTYTRNGAIYLFKANLIFHPENPSFYGDRVAAYIMPLEASVNIDSMDDWEEAEKTMTNKKSA